MPHEAILKAFSPNAQPDQRQLHCRKVERTNMEEEANPVTHRGRRSHDSLEDPAIHGRAHESDDPERSGRSHPVSDDAKAFD
jgi:hypothetical protein